LGGSGQLQAQEELKVLQEWMRFSNASNALYRHLTSQAFELLDQRAAEIQNIRTEQQWQKKQRRVRAALRNVLGPFPSKSPLNARVVSVIQKPDFRIEKILFESRPRFYVTAIMLVPNGLQGRAPGIIYCSGHAAEGFRSTPYQRVVFNLAKKGFVVLAFDPIGQGERFEYYDPELGRSRVGGPTSEHSVAGVQAFLAGSSEAHYMVWDGIRAVDYLLSRSEVDPERIGITGRSGGGTQSAYIAAVDDRIYAAAPECYLTSLRRLLETIGPQDAEQNFYHGLAHGLDHADLLEVRAPRPALLIATTRDFFSIQGVQETAAEVKMVYDALSKPDHFSVAWDDAPHASTQSNREAMYRFFQKHLGLPGNSEDEPVEILDPRELEVTASGQVSTSLDSRTVFNLNRDRVRDLKSKNENRTRNVLESARKLSGYREPAPSMEKPVFCGRLWRNGYSIEKYFLPGEGDYVLPFLLFEPSGDREKSPVLYLHPDGKSGEAGEAEEIETLVRKGHTVLAPDLLGFGELGSASPSGTGESYNIGRSWRTWFAALQIGRSIAGIHAGDIVRLVNFLKFHESTRNRKIVGVARGELGPAMLHAAAFDHRIERVSLIESLISYRVLAINRFYLPRFIFGLVPGALSSYDLSDLARSLLPRDLLLLDLVDQRGLRARETLISQELSALEQAYEESKLVIEASTPGLTATEILSEWLEN